MNFEIRKAKALSASRVPAWHDLFPTVGEIGLQTENVPVQFEIQSRDDLWELVRDGRLVGGYVSRLGALEAARSALHGIFCIGGSAELLAIAA